MLSLDIVQHEIAKYLNLVEGFCFSQTNKYYSNINFSQMLINTVQNRLKRVFGAKYEEFLKLLEESGALISGPFLIQCLLNEEWKCPMHKSWKSNIDIFIPTMSEDRDVLAKIEQWLIENNYIDLFALTVMSYEENVEKIWSIRNFMPCKSDKIDEYQAILKRDEIVANSKHYVDPNNHLIQTVQVKIQQEELEGFIWDKYDINIRKIIYGIKNNKSYIKIARLNEILTKTMRFEIPAKAVLIILWEYRRYIDRGFHFNNIDTTFLRSTIKANYNVHICALNISCNQITEKYKIYQLLNGHELFDIEIVKVSETDKQDLQGEYLRVENQLVDFNEIGTLLFKSQKAKSKYERKLYQSSQYQPRLNQTDCACDLCSVVKIGRNTSNLRHISYTRFIPGNGEYKSDVLFVL